MNVADSNVAAFLRTTILAAGVYAKFSISIMSNQKQEVKMNIKTVTQNDVGIAVITAKGKLITDVQSALDLIMTVKYETKAERIAIAKDCVADDFFILSTGLAGEVLQKFINYHVKVAFFGDFTKYTSKPLHDFIYESNSGKDVFFVGTEDEAVSKLGGC